MEICKRVCFDNKIMMRRIEKWFVCDFIQMHWRVLKSVSSFFSFYFWEIGKRQVFYVYCQFHWTKKKTNKFNAIFVIYGISRGFFLIQIYWNSFSNRISRKEIVKFLTNLHHQLSRIAPFKVKLPQQNSIKNVCSSSDINHSGVFFIYFWFYQKINQLNLLVSNQPKCQSSFNGHSSEKYLKPTQTNVRCVRDRSCGIKQWGN